MSIGLAELRWSTLWQQMLQNLDLLPIGAKREGAKAEGGRVEIGRAEGQGRIRRIEVSKGMVRAEVQGRKQGRKQGLCQVTIAFSPLRHQAWSELQTLFLQQAGGALPLDPQLLFSEKDPLFSQVSALLLPSHSSEIQPRCSCCPPDEQQCPALQAVYDQVGVMLDEEPVLLLRLRGHDWQQLVQEIQEHRAGSYPHAPTGGNQLANLGTKHELPTGRDPSGESDSLEAQGSNFWGSRRTLETFQHHIAPPLIDLTILRRLGPLPDALNDPVVDQQLAMLYRHITREAEALAYDLDNDELHDL